MSEPSETFQRQAAWQASRRLLPWHEKIKMAELLRDAALTLRKTFTETPKSGNELQLTVGAKRKET